MSAARKRYYEVSEVNRHCARLNGLFSDVMQLRGQLKTLYAGLEAVGHAPTNEATEEDEQRVPVEYRRDRQVFYALADTLRETLEGIAGTGCVIKDLEIGLVDWPAVYRGREIWLCWRYGETEVGFWHDHHTGFDGRRPVSELLVQPRAGDES